MRKVEDNAESRLFRLRELLTEEKLDGFIIPRADRHLGEEVPECAERLAWLTGFTGSAGIAAVLHNKAAVLTDGRYSIQVRKQTNSRLYECEDSTRLPVAQWIGDNMKEGGVIGYDPWLHSPLQIQQFEEKLGHKGIAFRPVEENLIDKLWADRPPPPGDAVRLYPDNLAGMSSQEKLIKTVNSIREAGGFAGILTLPDSIAWLLNIRGKDLKHTPVVLSFAMIRTDPVQVEWIVEADRIPPEVHKALGNSVRTIGPQALGHEVERLAQDARAAGKPVLLDFKRSPSWFRSALERAGARVRDSDDPCISLKMIKTEAEQQGMITAHQRDGLALVRFLSWLERQNIPDERINEITIADKLEEFRALDSRYQGPSFDTIAGFEANGAIIHYRATSETSKNLQKGSLLLLDSGAQYEEGTTDVTRTIAIGEPSEEMRRHYTIVLKSHIAVADAVFPEGTPGAQIDAFARKPLWENDIDYPHGTGHGVGCFLGVHEESASLSPRGTEKIRAGMILSNEPGFYRENAYGIRIENLVLAERTGRINQIGMEMLKFKTLTLVPFDRKLIDPDLLDLKEKDWINGYHGFMWKLFSKDLDQETALWLQEAVKPV